MNHATAHGEFKPVQSMFFALTNDCSPKTYTKGQNALAPIYQEVMPREHVDIWGLAGEESRKRERNIKYF